MRGVGEGERPTLCFIETSIPEMRHGKILQEIQEKTLLAVSVSDEKRGTLIGWSMGNVLIG